MGWIERANTLRSQTASLDVIAPRSGRQRHSHYIAAGQQALDAENLDDVTLVEAEVRDPQIARYRPLVLHPQGAVTGQARKRLQHLAAERQ